MGSTGWSGVSELGSGLWTVLGSLDVSNVVGEIIFDIGVTGGVKGDSLGFWSRVVTITGVIGVVDGSGDLSFSSLKIEVVLGNLSGSGLSDWDSVGVFFIS